MRPRNYQRAMTSIAQPSSSSRPHAELASRKCAACSGKVPTIPREEAMQTTLAKLPSWKYVERAQENGGDLISRQIRMRNFMNAIKLFNDIAQVAEAENHHPDLHLTGYRNVSIEINTHSVKGITEGDFILAAKIEDLLSEQCTSASKH